MPEMFDNHSGHLVKHCRFLIANTPNGSWGIVQFQPTTQMKKNLDAPRIQ